MRTAGLSARPIPGRPLLFLGFFLLLSDVGAAQAQSIATPLTFQDCLQRQRELRAEASQTSNRAWNIVKQIVGAGNSESNALYEKANELRAAASALHCAYHPDKVPSDASEVQEKSDMGINLLAKGIKAGPEEASSITNKVIKLGVDHVIEESVLGKLTVTPSTELKEYIQDRLKDVEAHNNTVMSQFDKTGAAITQVGQGNAVGTPAGFGQAHIDYSRIGSLGDPDRQRQDQSNSPAGGGIADPANVPANGYSAQATGYGSVSINYSTMFAADYQRAQETRAAAERNRPASEHKKIEEFVSKQSEQHAHNQDVATKSSQQQSHQPQPIYLSLLCKRVQRYDGRPGQVCLYANMGLEACADRGIINGMVTEFCGVNRFPYIMSSGDKYTLRIQVGSK